MVVFDKGFEPLKKMLEQNSIDLENCWNGNEALICAAATNCINCQKFDTCDLGLEGTCPNIFLIGQLPKRALH